MNDITLRDLLRFIDDDMRLHIHMRDGNGDLHIVGGTVSDLNVMLGAKILNRKVDIMTKTVERDVCVIVYPEMNTEDMQDEDLPPLYEVLKEYPAIMERLQAGGVMTTAKLISMTADELKEIDQIDSTAICRIRTGLAKDWLHLKGEEQGLAAPERGRTMRLSEALETYMNDRVAIYFTETMENIYGEGEFFGTILNEATLNKTVRDISRNNYGYTIRVEG
jgi:hypothetical protein